MKILTHVFAFLLAAGAASAQQQAGWINFASSATPPAAPTSGFKAFADSLGRFSWIGADGYTRTFGGTLTANRIYMLPDSSLPLGQSLAPTAIKTGAYALNAGDYVPADTTGGSLTFTLPNAPADGTQCGGKMVAQGGTNTITFVTQGADVFNKAGGATTDVLNLLNQAGVYQYSAAARIWYVVSSDFALSALDGRYVSQSTTVNGHALSGNIAVTPADLSLVIGTNVEAWAANLDGWAGKTPYAGAFAIAAGKTGTVNNSLTFAGTDGTTMTFPGTSDTVSTTTSTETPTNKTWDTGGTGNVFKFNGNLLSGGSSTGGTYGSILPIIVRSKTVTINSSGQSPSDIATITLPAGLTRYTVWTSTALIGMPETASGSLAAAQVGVFTASGGAGAALVTPAALSGVISLAGIGRLSGSGSSLAWGTSGTLYIRQTVDSANAGTVSFYVLLIPIP